MDQQGFRIGVTRFDKGSDNYQSILEYAHQEKRRPQCLCCPAEPEMYVAKLGNDFYLKRMPGTGHLHHSTCVTFDPPPEISGLGQVNGKAIVTEDSGETLLKLDFALSMRSGRVAPPPSSDGEATSAIASPSKLSLLGMLHYLWDEAQLSKWRSVWQGRRTWRTVYRSLVAVAEKTSAKAMPLSSVLFVPPTFSPDSKNELAAERRRFLHPLQPVKGKPVPLGMIVAEFKSQEPSQYGRRITFKHLPDMAFFMDEDLGKRFDRLAERKVQMIEAAEGAHLMVIATFAVRGNYAEIKEIAVMPVSAQWVPFDTDREWLLLDALQDRDYVKCLKYNLKPDAPIANALLLDTPKPVALYCPSEDIDPEDEAALRKIAEDGIYDPWFWLPGDFSVPALPSMRAVEGGRA